jgi:hypothetical protein
MGDVPGGEKYVLRQILYIENFLKMFFKGVAVAALLAARVSATIYYAGVAESSGEFGVYSKSIL